MHFHNKHFIKLFFKEIVIPILRECIKCLITLLLLLVVVDFQINIDFRISILVFSFIPRQK